MTELNTKVRHPAEYARDVIRCAFDHEARNQKASLRSLNRVISLAEKRGYPHGELFFSALQDEQGNSLKVKRMIDSLFEYVSAEEFSQLALIDEYRN